MFSPRQHERWQSEMTHQQYAYFPYPYQPDSAERIEVSVVARRIRFHWAPNEYGTWGWQPVPVAMEQFMSAQNDSPRAMPPTAPAQPIRTIYVTNEPGTNDLEREDDVAFHMVEGT